MERSRQIGVTANSPSTASTARLRTSSSSRLRQEYGYPHRKASDNEDSTIPRFADAGSILGMQVGSPGSPVKQREMPGAVDLTELRRLYENDYGDQTGFY